MVDLLYSPEQDEPHYLDNLMPEDNLERLRNIRDMFENSTDTDEHLQLQKVEKLQPSEKLMQRLSKFQEGGMTNEDEDGQDEEDNEENSIEQQSAFSEAPIKSNRRFNKKKDIIPFAEMNNVMSKFEKITNETHDTANQAPKPIRCITPPRRGANRIEIENTPQERSADVVSAFEKLQDTLPQQGFIRSRKEQFSSNSSSSEHNTNSTQRHEELQVQAGSAKQTAALFSDNERWANRLKSLEKSNITIEGELTEKGIAKSRLALFNEPNQLQNNENTQLCSHILPVNELDSEIFKSASGIAKERMNLFKNLEQQQQQQHGNMRISPSKEFKKLKEFTPPPQFDHPHRQYIIIDKESTNSSMSEKQQEEHQYAKEREEFIPESGLAKNRMKQYLEQSNQSLNTNSNANSEEIVSKGYAKSLLAKWKSMECVDNKETSPDPSGPRRFRAHSKEGSPSNSGNENDENSLIHTGNARSLLNKWNNIESNNNERRAPRQITPPPSEELLKNKSLFEAGIESNINKTVQNDQELCSIGRGHAKSTLAKFEQSVIESTNHVRKTVTPPREFINKVINNSHAIKSEYESTPVESLINSQFCEEDVIPSAGHAKQLKSKFMHLEKEAAKVETSSSKMNYVPKKFTSSSQPQANSSAANSQKQSVSVKKIDSAKLAAVEAGPQQQQQSTNNKENQMAFLNHHASTLSADRCCLCEKTVYAMEKIEADKKVYHKLCFKCTSCNCTLNEDSFVMEEGKPFCLKHMSKLPQSPAKQPPQSPAKKSTVRPMEPIKVETNFTGSDAITNNKSPKSPACKPSPSKTSLQSPSKLNR